MPLFRSIAEWRHDYANLALGGANLLILFVGLSLQTLTGWLISLGFIGITSFLAWFANLKRYRTVADTPTSRIASAPLGYIEVVGRGKQPPGDQFVSYLTGLPCLWYRYHIERKNGDRWEHVESGVSHDTFGIDDGTGMLLVDPDGAEIMTSRKQVSTEGDYRKTEWTLIEGETIYALGEHMTLGGANSHLDKRADVSSLLAEWKKDRPAMLAHFDINQDGEIDLAEWEQVRRAASERVDQEHLDIHLKDGIHIMRRPRHGLPFLVANREVQAVVRHYRLWSWFHLALILATLFAWVAVAHTSLS